MNRKQFLAELEKSLSKLPASERQDIVFDYEEHFAIAAEQGKSEEQTCQALGDPAAIAKLYGTEYLIKRAESSSAPRDVFRAALAAAALGFFNLVFVLGPFLGVAGAIFGLFVASLAVMFAGLTATFGPVIAPIVGGSTGVAGGAIVVTTLIGIGVFCFGVLFFIFNVYLGRLFVRLTIKYLKFNLDLIMNRRMQRVSS